MGADVNNIKETLGLIPWLHKTLKQIMPKSMNKSVEALASLIIAFAIPIFVITILIYARNKSPHTFEIAKYSAGIAIITISACWIWYWISQAMCWRKKKIDEKRARALFKLYLYYGPSPCTSEQKQECRKSLFAIVREINELVRNQILGWVSEDPYLHFPSDGAGADRTLLSNMCNALEKVCDICKIDSKSSAVVDNYNTIATVLSKIEPHARGRNVKETTKVLMEWGYSKKPHKSLRNLALTAVMLFITVSFLYSHYVYN